MPRGKLWDDLTFGRARRRREMRRRMRQLDRWYAGQTVPVPSLRRRREGWRRFFVLCTTTAVVSIASLVVLQRQGVVVDLDGLARRVGLASTGTEPPGPGPGTFAFLQHQTANAAQPVTYNPCRVIQVVVNEALAPLEGRALLTSALDEIAEATGLKFSVVGTTDDLPGADRSSSERYGGTWPPVLVAWTTPDQYAGLDGDVIGLGGSSRVTDRLSGRMTYVTGGISLDTPALERMLERPGGDRLVRAVILHELGHPVGLDHVDDRGELMSRENAGRTELGKGDRAGLAILGRGPCIDG